MSSKNAKIAVKGVEITFIHAHQEDFVCITGIAKYKNPGAPADIGAYEKNKSYIWF